VTFKKYSSSSLRILGVAQGSSGYQSSGVGVVTGATKLCLGCHDGLTALGAITTGAGDITIEMETETLFGFSSGYEDAGTVNIQNKHPVSFKYDATVLVNLTGVGYGLPGDNEHGTSKNMKVKEMVRRAGGRVECTICHDPHENKATNNREFLPFWVSGSYDDGTFGPVSSYMGVCVSCHSQSFGEYTFFGEYTTLR
jgi:hypothetical protein